MQYRIMDREMKAYSYEGFDAPEVYEAQRIFNLNPHSWRYGYVLVKMKRLKHGFSIRIKILFRHHWYWKPQFMWRYGIHYFHWLFFMIWVDPEFIEVIDHIETDHLSEQQKNLNSK